MSMTLNGWIATYTGVSGHNETASINQLSIMIDSFFQHFTIVICVFVETCAIHHIFVMNEGRRAGDMKKVVTDRDRSLLINHHLYILLPIPCVYYINTVIISMTK
jgi:hypothetical protein